MRRMACMAALAAAMAFLAAATTSPPPTLDSNGRTQADYDQHIAKLRKDLPNGFAIVQQPPFVVVGDETPAQVAVYSQRTVAWAVKMLKKEYFEKDPTDLITVYLFKDKASYDKYTKEIFNAEPTTPYGYYSPAAKALIMNIATGGGTLVHEIVHPFVAANFPECPCWFNEGLGSLYEQSSEKDGHIVGLTNWRLPGLQQAIKAEKVPSFEKLCALPRNDFYEKDRGTNYGQARYLCYYLQEKGLLRKYYQAFVKDQKKDPTGYDTLKQVLGEKDMDAFKLKWEKFVLGLRFP